MRGPNILFLGIAAFSNSIQASFDHYDFGNIPHDHVVFGPGGIPSNWTLDHPTSNLTSTHSTHLKRHAIPKTHLTSSNVSPYAPQKLSTRATNCTANTATRRDCWSDGFDIDTNYDETWPNTGTTVTYDWTITNTTCNPDGSGDRICLLVNNQYPGPTLEANWGDTISVTVRNNLTNNGTSIHWHGMRQLNNNGMDGTNGLTECPIAPGQSETYTWQATQYGTSWYHSHYSAQYGDGVSGPIVINGPATANYDIDSGAMPVTDWYYTPAFTVSRLYNTSLQAGSAAPEADTILINGTNGLNGGSYNVVNFQSGKVHRMRLINTGVDAQLRVSIDGHNMTVIAADFVPITPITADSVLLGNGQRYDVLINATETSGNYWMRAIAETACQSATNTSAQAIIRYEGASETNPTTNTSVTTSSCSAPGTLVPHVSIVAGNATAFRIQAQALDVDTYYEGVTSDSEGLIFWGVNTTNIDIQWDIPTLEYVRTGNTSYPTTANLVELPTSGIWTYWIIQEVIGGNITVAHPMHLHGHDFFILGSGTGTFNATTDADSLTYDNPPRRDTTILPAGGWQVLAFPTDNPGAWLFHCHIAWHIGMGLGVQFLESKNDISIPSQFQTQCAAWQQYDGGVTTLYRQDDSGL
ncbi:MAG: hypothetical protein Q9159_001889 [Coniocarpon cinnabarinum]